MASYRIAVLSDVHADVHALRDALRHIDAMGCDTIVCAGDLVDYGLFPDETIALLVERHIPTIRGNHDRWVFEAKLIGGGGWDLTDASRAFLQRLPLRWETTHEGTRVVVLHASPSGDMYGIDAEELGPVEARRLLDGARADVLVVGHTHRQFEVEVGDRGVIVNPGALLRSPAEGAENPRATATFGMVELPARRFTAYSATDGREVAIMRRRLN
jgi:putative phosphoesterase